MMLHLRKRPGSFLFKAAGIFLTSILLLSCATSGGNAVERTAERDRDERKKEETPRQDSSPSRPQQPQQPDWTRYEPDPVPLRVHTRRGYRIETSPSGAEVYFGSSLVGRTPFEQETSFPVREDVTLRMPGYRDVKFELYASGRNWDISSFTLDRILGQLDLDGSFSDSSVLLTGGRLLLPGKNRVPVGEYELVAQRFGFEDFRSFVTVREDEVQSLTAEWKETSLKPLSLHLIPPWRTSSGRISFSYEVSGPGEGVLEFTGPEGSILAAIPLGPFFKRYQEVHWEPSGDLLARLAPGEYFAVLKAGSAPPLKASFRLEPYQAQASPGEFWSSASGSLFVPEARTRPPGNFGVTGSVLGVSGGGYLQAYQNTALLIGLVPGWELDLAQSNRFWNDPYLNSFYYSASVKNTLLDGNLFALGWYASGSLSSFWTAQEMIPPTTDPFTNPFGWKLGTVFSLGEGRWKLHGAPELAYLGRGVSYESSSDARAGWGGYLRMGLEWEADGAVVKASTALRTGLLEDGFTLRGPFQTGWEVRTRPWREWGLNFLGVMEWWNPADWALALGVGLSYSSLGEEEPSVRKILPRRD